MSKQVFNFLNLPQGFTLYVNVERVCLFFHVNTGPARTQCVCTEPLRRERSICTLCGGSLVWLTVCGTRPSTHQVTLFLRTISSAMRKRAAPTTSRRARTTQRTCQKCDCQERHTGAVSDVLHGVKADLQLTSCQITQRANHS